jgi:hypothetical protein
MEKGFGKATSYGMKKLAEYMDKKITLSKESSAVNQEWQTIDPDEYSQRPKFRELETRLDDIRRENRVLDENISVLASVLKVFNPEQLKTVLDKFK